MTYEEAFYNLRGKILAIQDTLFESTNGMGNFFTQVGKDELCKELLAEVERLRNYVKVTSGE